MLLNLTHWDLKSRFADFLLKLLLIYANVFEENKAHTIQKFINIEGLTHVIN